MDLYEILKAIANDTEVDLSNKKKIIEFVNRGYRECAKRTRVELLPIVEETTDNEGNIITTERSWKLSKDEDIPQTHDYNNEFIIAYALYLIFLAKNEADKANIYKVEVENYKLKIKPLNIRVRPV